MGVIFKFGVSKALLALCVVGVFSTLISFATVVCASQSQFNKGDCVFTYFDQDIPDPFDPTGPTISIPAAKAGAGFILMLLAWFEYIALTIAVGVVLRKQPGDDALGNAFVSENSAA
jgi:hypothetical protein